MKRRVEEKEERENTPWKLAGYGEVALTLLDPPLKRELFSSNMDPDLRDLQRLSQPCWASVSSSFQSDLEQTPPRQMILALLATLRWANSVQG